MNEQFAIIFLGSIAAGATYLAASYHKELSKVRKLVNGKAEAELKFLGSLQSLVKLMGIHPHEHVRRTAGAIDKLAATYASNLRKAGE
jgi:hypothetical protein